MIGVKNCILYIIVQWWLRLQCREIAVTSHNEMTKVATELHSVSNRTFMFFIYYQIECNCGFTNNSDVV